MHSLNEEDGKFLLDLARTSIRTYMRERKMPHIEENEVPGKLRRKGASFVTLTINGRLKGCIGTLEAEAKLYEDVMSNAVNAAFHDPRFFPLSEMEYDMMDVEVSVLSEPKKSSVSKIVPGKHGVIFEFHGHRATFLPQVWEEIPDKDEFLLHLCSKAGLPPGTLQEKDAKFFIYTVQAFHE